MRTFEQLLPEEEDVQIIETSRDYTRCFWISYSLCLIGLGALIMWLFFKFVIMV